MTTSTPVATSNNESTAGRVIEIDAATVSAWLDDRGTALVDVREPDEHAAERIEGATSLPLSSFNPADLPAVEGDKLVLHCRSGHRSADAARRVIAAGSGDVYTMTGGLQAWKQAGLEVHRTARAPMSIMRQVQITTGSMVLLGALLGAFVTPWFLLLSGFVGAGLIFAGTTGLCGMATLLQLIPWNRRRLTHSGRLSYTVD